MFLKKDLSFVYILEACIQTDILWMKRVNHYYSGLNHHSSLKLSYLLKKVIVELSMLVHLRLTELIITFARFQGILSGRGKNTTGKRQNKTNKIPKKYLVVRNHWKEYSNNSIHCSRLYLCWIYFDHRIMGLKFFLHVKTHLVFFLSIMQVVLLVFPYKVLDPCTNPLK